MVGNYNIIAQEVSLTFACMTLYLMLRSNPRKTDSYVLNFSGIILSIIEIFLMRWIFQLIDSPKLFSRPVLDLLILLFYEVYIVILSLFFLYFDYFSYQRREQKRQAMLMRYVIGGCYTIVYLYFLMSGRMYVINESGVHLTHYFHVYLYLGMTECIFVILAALSNFRTIGRRMAVYIFALVPLDFLLLLMQLIYPRLVFSAVTYVFPFVICYFLLHSNPYDVITGGQNLHSFVTRYEEFLKKKKHFVVLTARFPKDSFVERYNESKHLDYLVSYKCREIESVCSNLYLYSLNDYTYAGIVRIKDDDEIAPLVEKITRILDAPTQIGEVTYTTHYKMVVVRDSEKVENATIFAALQKYLLHKMGDTNKTEKYIAAEQDYIDFEKQWKVDQLLQSIHYAGDLNDSRVLCYAQPIYSVEKREFRTAEALMRLKLGDEIIYPDRFIPAAERTNCIHTLTCIILNKVCQEVRRLEDDYDFDAITINCSSTEFSDMHLHEELLEIIRNNGINPSKICLELTESAMFEDDHAVEYNIRKLREANVQFYLDDFGTGYSNLERIVTCPFKTIKFDKSLLYHALGDEAVDDMMSSMIEVFRKQGFNLLVEGVEDADQRDYSIDKGFHFIQGYNYAKPLPIEELVNYFAPLHE